jgi:hypothetical protein
MRSASAPISCAAHQLVEFYHIFHERVDGLNGFEPHDSTLNSASHLRKTQAQNGYVGSDTFIMSGMCHLENLFAEVSEGF